MVRKYHELWGHRTPSEVIYRYPVPHFTSKLSSKKGNIKQLRQHQTDLWITYVISKRCFFFSHKTFSNAQCCLQKKDAFLLSAERAKENNGSLDKVGNFQGIFSFASNLYQQIIFLTNKGAILCCLHKERAEELREFICTRSRNMTTGEMKSSAALPEPNL